MEPYGKVGLIYQKLDISENGNSGWIDVAGESSQIATIARAVLLLVPNGVAGAEEEAFALAFAWDASGTQPTTFHNFTAVTVTNATELVIVPGDESVGNLVSAIGSVPAPIPDRWRLSWVNTNGWASDHGVSLYGSMTVIP